MSGSGRKSTGGKEDENPKKSAPKKTRASLSKADAGNDDNENLDKDPKTSTLTKKELEAEVEKLQLELAKSKSLLNSKESNINKLTSKLKASEAQCKELSEQYNEKCNMVCPNCQARQMTTQMQPSQAQPPAWQAPPLQAPVWQAPPPQPPVYQPVQQAPVYQPVQQAAVWQPQAPTTWYQQPRPQPPPYQGGYGYQGNRRRGGGYGKGWYQSYQPY